MWIEELVPGFLQWGDGVVRPGPFLQSRIGLATIGVGRLLPFNWKMISYGRGNKASSINP